MKKITLLLMLLCSTGWLSAQCLEFEFDPYPAATFTPAVCDGATPQVITPLAWASEYSTVNVVSGETYVFTSSISSDFVTISDADGTEAYIFGQGGVIWVSDMDGVIRFYVHTDEACGASDEEFRTRAVTCGTPPACFAPTGVSSANVTDMSATINFNPSMSEPLGGYDYFLSTENVAPEDGTEPTGNVAESPLLLEELSATTPYWIWVRAVCGEDGYSTWSAGSFTTNAPPPSCEDMVVMACNQAVDAVLPAGPGAWNPFACGYNTPGTEAIFSYTPSMTGPHSLKVNAQSGGWIDYFYKVAGDCSGTGWTCIDDINGAATVLIGELTEGTEYWFLLDGESTEARTSTFLITCPPTCTNGVATYTVVPDCEEGDQFLIDVALTNMGTAESYTVTDDQGSDPQAFTDLGTLQFGPYPNGTSVVITLANDQDETCVMTSPPRTLTVCPPANDTCAGAIDLATLTSPYIGSTVGALDDNLTYCPNGGGAELANLAPDTYYSIEVPSGSTLSIGQTANSYDSTTKIFYGDCDNRTMIDCYDDYLTFGDIKTTVWANDTGEQQTVYWIQDGYNAGSGSFTLAWSVVACSNAAATFTVVSDCEEGEQFMISVNLTSLGSATSVTIADNQGSTAMVATEAAVYSFGPYPNATSVSFTITNDQDADCTITSSALTQAACPPNCDEATVIEECGTPVTVMLTGGGVWSGAQCFWPTPGAEAVFSFTPAETGLHNLVITSLVGGYTDYFYKEASGTCDQTGWICIGDSNAAETNVIGTLTAGVEYLILLDAESTAERNITFQISCAIMTPENDACADATEVDTFPYEGAQDATGATNNTGFISQCGGQNDGVWYTFVGDGGDVTISVMETGWDSKISVYTGECGAFTCVDSEDSSFAGDGEELVITETELGVQYRVNVGYYSGFTNSPEGAFTIEMTSTMMSIGDDKLTSFTYHPNPVNDRLNLSNATTITNASVFNLLGQQVMSADINATIGSVDMSALPTGTYLVRVTADNVVKTIKIIKAN